MPAQTPPLLTGHAPAPVLLVDDQPANLLALEAALEGPGFDLVRADSGEEALRRAADRDFAVVLLDLAMPGLDGFETAKLLRARDRSRETPVIFVTAAHDTDFPVAQAYALGAVDYIVKPLNPDVLRAKVSVFVDLYRKAERLRELERGQRVRAEEALRRAEGQLRLVFESATDYAIFSTDPGGVVATWNAGAERLFGWAAADIVGRSGDVLFTPEDRAAGVPAAELAKAAGVGRAEDERWHVRRDGTRFYASGVVTPIRDGHLRGFAKVARDVTGRKRTEERLARDARLLASVSDAVVVTDLGGTVTYWNEGATRLFGWAAGEMLGRPLTDRFPEEERAGVAASVRAIAAGGEWAGEFEDYHKDGSRVWIDARVCRYADPAGAPAGIIGVSRDVSDRKRLEEVLRRRAEELAEADRRKDEFLATLAHELRNPLAPVRNGLALLRLTGGLPAGVVRTREMMERQVGHLVRLVDDLLDVSRVTRGKLELRRERTDLSAAVRSAVEAALPLVEAGGHHLAVDLPPEPVWVDADPARLTQAVTNLLNNAAKYTGEGGGIRVSAGRDDGEAVVRVRDTGVGIPAEALARVFDPFTQLGRSADGRARGGLGIGLSLVKRLVEMHGGTVEAFSEGPGRGSEFVVRLPLAADGSDIPTSGADSGPTKGE